MHDTLVPWRLACALCHAINSIEDGYVTMGRSSPTSLAPERCVGFDVHGVRPWSDEAFADVPKGSSRGRGDGRGRR